MNYEPYECHLRYLNSEGSYVTFHLKVEAALVPKKNDISQIKITDLAFEKNKSTSKLEIAMKAAGFEFWESNILTGEITRKATHIFEGLGYTDEESLDNISNFASFVHPDDLPRLLAAIDDHYHKKTDEYCVEFRTKSKSGEWEWIANYGRIIPTNGEWGECFTGVSVNINDKKINENTKRKAEKMLLMKELVGGVAHNFNNNLAGITGNLLALQRLCAVK